MLNQLAPSGEVGFFLCPSAVTAGMPVLIGDMPAVAIDNYSSVTGGTTFCFEGVFALTVIGQSSQSPVSGLAIKPGDQLFATGTFDATTNVTYNLTIDKTRGNIPFGAFFPVNAQTAQSIASGATSTTAPVKINPAAAGPHGL
jgi:predicted RecA/RadA family phage recombinase